MPWSFMGELCEIAVKNNRVLALLFCVCHANSLTGVGAQVEDHKWPEDFIIHVFVKTNGKMSQFSPPHHNTHAQQHTPCAGLSQGHLCTVCTLVPVCCVRPLPLWIWCLRPVFVLPWSALLEYPSAPLCPLLCETPPQQFIPGGASIWWMLLVSLWIMALTLTNPHPPSFCSLQSLRLPDLQNSVHTYFAQLIKIKWNWGRVQVNLNVL